jgi:hypothetical protein
MNITLSVLNAAALVALVVFHFHDNGPVQQAAVDVQPHALHQPPQLAVMTDRTRLPQAATLANDSDAPATNERLSANDQRWVF